MNGMLIPKLIGLDERHCIVRNIIGNSQYVIITVLAYYSKEEKGRFTRNEIIVSTWIKILTILNHELKKPDIHAIIKIYIPRNKRKI